MRIISKFHDYYDSVARDDARDAKVWVRKPQVEHAEIAGVPLPWNAEVPGRQDGGVCGERTMDGGLGWRGRSALERALNAGTVAPEVRQAARDANNALEGAREALVLVAGKAYPVFVARNGFLGFADQYRDDGGPGAAARRLAALRLPATLDIPAHARGRRAIGGTAHDILEEWRQCVRQALEAVSGSTGGRAAIAELPGGSIQEFLGKAKPRFHPDAGLDDKHGRRQRVYAEALAQAEAFDWTRIHLRFGSPVLMLARLPEPGRYGGRARADRLTEIVVGPCLDMLRFSSRIDPFTLFQEVSMFVEGVMPAQGHEMATLSDASRILKAGFDPKYGFRKRPRAGSGQGGSEP